MKVIIKLLLNHIAIVIMQACIATEEQSSHCSTSDDSFLKDKIEELDQKIEGILNQTQGNYAFIMCDTIIDIFYYIRLSIAITVPIWLDQNVIITKTVLWYACNKHECKPNLI
jgi:hypothetical protein